MKLIDQTPLLDENGEIGIMQRVQGTLKHGLDWYPEMEAQKSVLAHLSRVLGKNYTVIRNQTLGASGITVPLVVVGPAGIYAVHITHLRGQYQAQRDEWGQTFGTNYKAAPVNLLTRTQLFARALQAFIERQGVRLPKPVEPVILSANPGLHVDSMQPIVRIVMVDALERWAASLEGAAPVLTVETAHELADRIVNPRPPKKDESEAVTVPPESEEEPDLSRAGAIFQAANEAETFNPEELGFAFEDDDNLEIPPELVETSPAVPLSRGETKRRVLGMTLPQLGLLGGIVLVEICVLIGFAWIILQNS